MEKIVARAKNIALVILFPSVFIFYALWTDARTEFRMYKSRLQWEEQAAKAQNAASSEPATAIKTTTQPSTQPSVMLISQPN